MVCSYCAFESLVSGIAVRAFCCLQALETPVHRRSPEWRDVFLGISLFSFQVSHFCRDGVSYVEAMCLMETVFAT